MDMFYSVMYKHKNVIAAIIYKFGYKPVEGRFWWQTADRFLLSAVVAAALPFVVATLVDVAASSGIDAEATAVQTVNIN